MIWLRFFIDDNKMGENCSLSSKFCDNYRKMPPFMQKMFRLILDSINKTIWTKISFISVSETKWIKRSKWWQTYLKIKLFWVLWTFKPITPGDLIDIDDLILETNLIYPQLELNCIIIYLCYFIIYFNDKQCFLHLEI